MKRFVLAVLATALLLALGSAGAGGAAPTGAGDAEFVPGELIVRCAPSASSAERNAALNAVDGTVEEALPVPGMRLVDVGPAFTVLQAISRLSGVPGVLYADPNYVYETSATTPNDPNFGLLWALRNSGQTVNGSAGTAGADIGATRAWDRGTGSKAIEAGVIDSGILLNHPDLAPNLWTNPGEIAGNGLDDEGNGYVDDVNGYDFAQNDSNPTDSSPLGGHGTHVAGTVGALGNNAAGVAGVNWQVSLAALKVFPDTSDPNLFGATTANLIKAIQYAGARGLTVVNGSLGGAHPQIQAERDALQAAPNTLFVFAAG